MKINSHLRKYGYRPELSGKYDKYEDALARHLNYDEDRYTYLYNLREYASSNPDHEKDIAEFAGSDQRLLRLIYSQQIGVSIAILEKIITIIKDLDLFPTKVLELGGSDGWAIDFLTKRFDWNAALQVLDRNKYLEPINKNVGFLNFEYSEFESNENFDLIYSILGSNKEDIEDFFKCISKSCSKDGTIIIGLRIASYHYFIEILKLASKYNLYLVKDYSSSISTQGEAFPVMTFKHGNYNLTQNDILMCVRKCFQNYNETKRVFGLEAKILLELIQDGEIIHKDTMDWDSGDHFEIRVINKNGILYRLSTNTKDYLIEFPVGKNDKNNQVINKLKELNTNPNLWDNTV